jgi:hypothetical protein
MDKKTGLVFLLTLSFLMSIALGMIVPASNTGSVTLESFGFIFVLSFVLTSVLGFILPIHKMQVWFTGMFGYVPEKGVGKLLGILFSNTLLMLIITFIMIGLLTGFSEVGETNYLGRYATGLISIQPIIVMVCIFADPLALTFAKKITQPRVQKQKSQKR